MYVVGGGGRFAKTQVLSCCKWFSRRYLREFNQSRGGHGRYIDRANVQYVPR